MIDIPPETQSVARKAVGTGRTGEHIMKSKVAILASVCLAATAAHAQTSPAPMTAVIGNADQNVLRAGTPIALKTSEGLSTEGKKLRAGQRFQLEVAEPVTLAGNVVIPAGSPATGEVTDVRNKGMWGKSGRINARLLFVRVNGRQIRLTGQVDDKGVTGTGGVVASVALVPLAGFFVTGTSARIPVGSPVNGFIDEDLPITFAASSAQPMVVAQPMAAPIATTPVVPAVAEPKKH